MAAAFATLESIAILTMFLRTRIPSVSGWFPATTRRKDNFIIPMLLTINIVEWSEVAVWSTNPSDADAAHMALPCNSVNRAFTSLAGCVVWLQPPFTMMYARFTGPVEERAMFTIPLVLAVVTACAWYLRFLLGELSVAQYASHEKMALSWTRTCSYVGLTRGHLEWRFALANISVLPTMFSYHLFFNLALAFHNFPIGFVAAAGSVFTLCVEFAAVEGSGEAWSIWCWSGCLFIGYYWVVNSFELDWDGLKAKVSVTIEPISRQVGETHEVDAASDGEAPSLADAAVEMEGKGKDGKSAGADPYPYQTPPCTPISP